MAPNTLEQRCQSLQENHEITITRFRLAKLLKDDGYRYTPAKKSPKHNHANKLGAQQAWCKRLVYYQQVLQLPVYYIDESSINLWGL
jgi:hypothetical protein